jgi:hypothetical protein
VVFVDGDESARVGSVVESLGPWSPMVSPSLSAVLRRVVAALLLAAGVACAGGEAQAGCGDYLTIDGKPHASQQHPTLPAKPCDGPNCSANPSPAQTPMTAPAPAPTGAKGTAVGSQLAGDNPSSNSGFSRPVSDGHSVHLPRSVFHPPRNG